MRQFVSAFNKCSQRPFTEDRTGTPRQISLRPLCANCSRLVDSLQRSDGNLFQTARAEMRQLRGRSVSLGILIHTAVVGHDAGQYPAGWSVFQF